MILLISATPIKQINPYMLFLIKAINMHRNDTLIIPMVFFMLKSIFTHQRKTPPFVVRKSQFLWMLNSPLFDRSHI